VPAAEALHGRKKVFIMSAKVAKKIAVSVRTTVIVATAGVLSGKEMRESSQQICIHGITRQSCFACAGRQAKI
jgi:hypothetical protein